MESEEEEIYCSNCKRSVAAKNFAIHSAYCERNIFVCEICKEPVAYKEKDEHFENYHVISPCSLCEAPIEKWMLPDHMEICPKRLIVCEYCEAEFRLNQVTEHVEFCGSRTEKCLLCQKYVMIKDKSKHTQLHKCEKKYQREKIEKEIEQNKVNEEISNIKSCNIRKSNSEDFLRKEKYRTVDSKTRIETNFEGTKESAIDKTSCDSKRMEQDYKIQSLQGATALPDRAKEKSSRYGECHICKQSIPWIDMNTHIPSCASLAGKCSLCGENVPNHAMKDHMREHISDKFQMRSIKISENSVSYMKKNSSNDDQNDAAKIIPHSYKHADGIKSSSMNEYKCPLCLKMVPREDKNRHETSNCEMLQDNTEFGNSYFTRSISQSFHECTLCSEKVPEENWQSHSTFDCKMLLKSRGSDDTSCVMSDGSYSIECPYCLAWMPEKDKKKHELFECKTLIDISEVLIPEPKSYADAIQKTCQCSCRKKANNCWKCKNNPQNKMSDYHTVNKETKKHCQPRKVTCYDCKENVEFSTKDEHEKYCPALKSNKNSSKHRIEDKHKGAIPKKTSLREMMRPVIGKCKYCHTTLNVDIVKCHEDECIHQPMHCPECQGTVLIKDLENHECKKKKKKEMKYKGEQQVPEEKTNSVFKKVCNYMFNSPSNEGKDEKENITRQQFSSYSYSNYQQVSNTEGSQPSYFQETMLPCEFCNEEFPASELVLHETGCEPDLVSHTVKKPSESPNLDKSKAKSYSVPSNKEIKESIIRYDKSNMGGMEQTFFPENSFSTSDCKKHERKSDTEPGEFLQFKYDKSSSRNHEGTGNESKGKKEENSIFQSVWNSGSTTDNGIEDHSDQILKNVEEPMDTDKSNEVNTTNVRTLKHGSEFMRQSTEEMKLKDDMNAIFCFLDDDRNKKYDKENEIESEVDEKRAEFINSKHVSSSTFGSNLLKEHVVQKNHQNCLDERNTSIKEESARLFQESTRSIAHSSSNGIEINTSIRQLKDFNLNTYKSAAISSAVYSYKQTSVEGNLLEKKDYEPEVSTKQKILLDAPKKSNKPSIDDFKKYLPDLKFASPKEKSPCTDDENDDLCSEDRERYEKLFEKHVNETSTYDRLLCKEECTDSSKNQTDFKFGMYQTSTTWKKENVSKTMEDEKLKQSHKDISIHAYNSESNGDYFSDFKKSDLKSITHENMNVIQEYNRLENNKGKQDEAHKEYIDCSKHIRAAKDDRKLASNFSNLTDSAAHLKAERCSLKNTDCETFLQKNKVDVPAMPGIEKTSVNTTGVNECISNYKKYFPDFKFAASEKSTFSKEDSIRHTILSEKNLTDVHEKLCEQQLQKTSKHSDCSEIERESANSLNLLANSKYASNKSTVLPCYTETHQRKLHVKDDEPEKLHLYKTSTYIDNKSKNEMECSNDFRKYLPDFKFGSQITRSSGDKTYIAHLNDKIGHSEESASKPQAAQLSLIESVDILGEETRKKVKDLETKIANIKKQSQKTVEAEHQAKWRKWRESPNSSSSDSE